MGANPTDQGDGSRNRPRHCGPDSLGPAEKKNNRFGLGTAKPSTEDRCRS